MSQYRAPLSPNQKCERFWTPPRIGLCSILDHSPAHSVTSGPTKPRKLPIRVRITKMLPQ